MGGLPDESNPMLHNICHTVRRCSERSLACRLQNITEQINEPSIKEFLKQETDSAIELGVFGVPTMIIDEQLFWGNDQFDHMSLYIEGNDPIDAVKVAEALDRKRAIDRKYVSV